MHGTRASYQQGCHCLTCRGAEAAYHRWLRAGRPRSTLGSTVPAGPAKQLVAAFVREGYTKRQLSRLLGYLRPGPIRLHTRVTMRNWLRLRWLARRLL